MLINQFKSPFFVLKNMTNLKKDLLQRCKQSNILVAAIHT